MELGDNVFVGFSLCSTAITLHIVMLYVRSLSKNIDYRSFNQLLIHTCSFFHGLNKGRRVPTRLEMTHNVYILLGTNKLSIVLFQLFEI